MTNEKTNPSEGEKKEADDKATPGGTTKEASKGKGRVAASKSVAAKRAQEKNVDVPKKLDAPVTEKGVPLSPPKRTSEFVMTIDNVTGLPVKIEKLDSETGERKELSKEEYLQVVSHASPSPAVTSLAANLAVPGADGIALAQSYYRGVIDYLNSVSST